MWRVDFRTKIEYFYIIKIFLFSTNSNTTI
nr:MAG TPA: hypothetical protein [Caudoviricetes sp.]